MLLSAGILKPGAGAMTIEYLVSATVIILFLLNLVSINQFVYIQHAYYECIKQ